MGFWLNVFRKTLSSFLKITAAMIVCFPAVFLAGAGLAALEALVGPLAFTFIAVALAILFPTFAVSYSQTSRERQLSEYKDTIKQERRP